MDPLQTLLQFLVTDASTVEHLSYILDRLSPSCFTPTPHLQKWVTRVTTMMHSKDPAVRWAAMCIAYRMSFLSKSLLIDNAQSWVGIVLPCLAKAEPVPILRVSMRYLSLVLCVAGHNLEFQRQVASPVVLKVSSALLTIAEKHNDSDIMAASIRTLAQLVPLYPSPHKALSQKLFAFCNQIFSGSVCATDSLLDATTNLYSVLHFLGGKAGSATLWRNCLDESLQLSRSAWLALRTTFPTSVQLGHTAMGHLNPHGSKPPDHILHRDPVIGSPLATVTLNLDRLKCGISTIVALLRAPINRPVRLPIGPLSTLCWCLLSSTLDDEGETHLDPHMRAAESGVVPQIWLQACRLLSCLAETAQGLLTPHASKLIMVISSHLENKLEESQRYSFLQCAYHLLHFCPVVGVAVGVNRLLKATILILSPLYLHQSCTQTNSGGASHPRASKKRRRDYEVDNVLSATNVTVCQTTEECDTLIAALDVANQCMLNTELNPSTRSLASRVLLSILVSLSSMPPSNLSSNPNFHKRAVRKVCDTCIESVQGVSHALGKGTSLFLRSFSSETLMARDKLHCHVDLLLHPRRPPFVRSLPFVESLSLSSAEESAEETATRHSLDLAFGNEQERSATCERLNCIGPISQSTLVPDLQAATNPLWKQTPPTSIALRSQTTNDVNGGLSVETAALPVVPAPPPPKAVPIIQVESPLLSSENVLVPTVQVAPMLVDESDHEEGGLPPIDLGSDSDA